MKLCSVENCGRNHEARGYCQRHNRQIQKWGSVLKRTKKDPNEINNENGICKIKLYNQYCEEIAEAKCDSKHEIEKYDLKWYVSAGGYVESHYLDENNKGKIIKLHQLIFQILNQEVPDGYEIDHKDGDKLNNLDDNLRICTHTDNMKNKKKYKNNTSGFTGVTWHKRDKKWEANIKQEYLGHFNTKEEAARAYNAAAIKYFGEFAVLNEV